MRKTVSTILVGLMIIGMMGYIQATGQEGNELEELMGLEVNIIYQITGKGMSTTIIKFDCKGIVIGIKEFWIIVLVKKKYVWCYIPTIRKIEILDKDYKPIKSLREIGKEMEEDDG